MLRSSVNDCAHKILLSLNVSFRLFQLNMLYCVLFWMSQLSEPTCDFMDRLVNVSVTQCRLFKCIPGSSLKSSVSMTNSISTFGVIWMGLMTFSAILTVDFLYSKPQMMKWNDVLLQSLPRHCRNYTSIQYKLFHLSRTIKQTNNFMRMKCNEINCERKFFFCSSNDFERIREKMR